MTPRDAVLRDGLVDVWLIDAVRETGAPDVDAELVVAVDRASELRSGAAVTSEQVRAQLPSPYPRYWPNPEAEWDVRSIAQRLRHLADKRRLFRSGMWSDGAGTPAVQHWAPSPLRG